MVNNNPGDGKRLKRTLRLHECVFYGVGSILGAGIYAIVGKVARFSGNMLWLAFAIASFTALMTAFSYAELSSMFPRAGAEYVYVKEAINKKLALVVGIAISCSGIVSGATVSIGFAGYLLQLVPIGTFLASIGIIALIFMVNASGIRKSSTVNIIFTIIEAGGLILVVVSAWQSIGDVNYTEPPPQGLNGILVAGALSYFAFLGFEEIVKLSEETIEPQRTIPRALFLACAIVIVIYIIISICAVSAMPWQELGRSDSPLADVVKSKYGQTGAVIISVVALFSTSNTILSNMIGSSRVLYDISKEYKLLRIFSVVSPGSRIPVAALILVAAIMIPFAAIGKIEVVALIANLFLFSTFFIINLSVILLRIKNSDIKRPYRIPFDSGLIPLTAILGMAMTLLMTGYTIYALVKGIEL